MSFHRVLPLLPALSNEALERRWAIQPDTLLSSKIMPDETTQAASKDKKPPTPKPNSSSPPEDKASPPLGDEELEDYESPKYPTRSLLRESDVGIHSSKTTRPSVSQDPDADAWIGEPPSSLCLCQPDPKVPRPRNGMYSKYRWQHPHGPLTSFYRLPGHKLSIVIWWCSCTDNLWNSFYSLSPTQPSRCRCAKSWSSQPRDLKNHW